MDAGENTIENWKFLTLTFNKGFHRFPIKTLIRTSLPAICKYMKHIAHSYTLGLELTEVGIVHYHLLINVKDMIKYKIFNNYWGRHYGFVKSITPRNLEKCSCYVSKELNGTLNLIFGTNIQFNISHLSLPDILDIIKNPLCEEPEPKTILDYVL